MKKKLLKIKNKFKFVIYIFIFNFSSGCTYIAVQLAENTEQKIKISDSILQNPNAFGVVDLSESNYEEQYLNIDSLIKIQNEKNNHNYNYDYDYDSDYNYFLDSHVDSINNIKHININKNTIQDTISNTQKSLISTEIEKYSISTTINSINSDYYPDSIIINVIVQDNNNSFISGLAYPYLSKNKIQEDYWLFVLDSCRNISLKNKNFIVEEIRQITSPKYSICYVLDHSGSMGDERALMLQQSVRYSINKIKEEDFISAIKFTEKSTTEVFPTLDKEKFKQDFKLNALGSPKYGRGGTDILLALDSAAEVLKNISEEYKRIVVLFTDGESNMADYKKIIKKLKNYKIKVFTVCYGNVDAGIMSRIAKDTDGKMIIIQKISDFAKAFSYIYNSLTNYYKITYKPPVCDDLHNVKIQLNLLDIGFDNLECNSDYDKSIFHNFATVGTGTFLDIEFDYNKSSIKPESIEILKNISVQLTRNKDNRIKICGHTDNIGSDEYNQRLSLDRAESVKKKLVEFGINESRIETEGFGKSRPVVPNDTEENRKKNRRTEFFIIE